MKWWEQTVTGYDCESTGVDPHRDRIVSAAVVYVTPGERPRTVSWLIDPGIPVPEEAAAVHGWSTDRLHAQLDGAQAQRTVNGTTRPISREAAIELLRAGKPAIELLRAGKPALAFYRIARTTEDEANILGLTGTRIPMAPAMQRLARRGWV